MPRPKSVHTGRICHALTVFLAIATLAIAGAPAAHADPPSSVIVVYKDTVDVDKKTDALERGNSFVSDFRYKHSVHGFAATVNSAVRAKIAQDPDIAYVENVRPISVIGAAEPVVPGDLVPTGVRRIEAGTAVAVNKASDVAVAVVDSGIDLNNKDLNVVDGKNCIKKGKGAKAQDDHGHGTHVAGTIAAKNNGSGVVGVAPNTKVYAVKSVGRDGHGTSDELLCGIDWVAEHAAALNIKVVNISLGDRFDNGGHPGACGIDLNVDAVHAAICTAVFGGITFVVAAGNDSADLGDYFPAAYPEVLTVTAMSDSDGKPGGVGGAPTCANGESDDARYSASNYAVTDADKAHTLAAPGVCIKSDWIGNKALADDSGTSMAAPHVTGTVALCLSAGGVAGLCAGLLPRDIITLMRDAAAAQPGGYGFSGDPKNSPGAHYYGHLVHQPASTTGPSYGAQIVLPFNGLHQPQGVAVDAAGNVFVVDTSNQRVVELTTAGQQLVLPFGNLTFPSGVAVDSSGNVYVTDPAYGTIPSRVLKLAPGADSPAVLPFTDISGVQGIAVDAIGNVYVGDGVGVRKLAPGAEGATLLPFTDVFGPVNGVAVNAAGDVVITDPNHNRVLRLAAGTATQTELPFTGLRQPQGVAIDSVGNIIVADPQNQRVLRLAPGQSAPTPLPFTGLRQLWGVAVDATGSVFATDYGGTEVLKLPVN